MAFQAQHNIESGGRVNSNHFQSSQNFFWDFFLSKYSRVQLFLSPIVTNIGKFWWREYCFLISEQKFAISNKDLMVYRDILLVFYFICAST